MADIIEYVQWRGDLPFSRDPFNEVDAAVFSELSYIKFGGSVEAKPFSEIILADAAAEFLSEQEDLTRVRVKADLDLLRLAANTLRFGQSRLFLYRDTLVPEQETQYASVTFVLDDGTLFLAFRGTDGTLVGWKEDFNMTFQQTIPAQRLALQYVREVYQERSEPMRLGGHSKGGNMAVFAAARSSPMVQSRILQVFNLDGPGFNEYMMGDPGYLEMVSRIKTFVPQSSVIGMLLEHEELYTVVRSKSVSIWQHDLYNWEPLGNHMLSADQISDTYVFVDATLKHWFSSMSNQERNRLVDALYSLLSTGGVENAIDIFHFKNIILYLKAIIGDEDLKKLLTTEFFGLMESAKLVRQQLLAHSSECPSERMLQE